MAQSLPSVSPQQHLLLTLSLTKSCLGQLSLPTNPPAHQPNPTGEHTSWYSSFLAHSPNFWLTQGLWWHFAEWKKNLRVAADNENPLHCCFSPSSLLSSAWPGCSPSMLQDGTHGAPWHTGHAPATGQEHGLMGMQQGQPGTVPFAIPAAITWEPWANSYWSCLEGGREQSWQQQQQRAWLSEALTRAKLKAGPLFLNLNPSLLGLDPTVTVQQPVGEGCLPSAQNQARSGNRAQPWAAHCGFPSYKHFSLHKVTREPSPEGAKATPALKGSNSHALVMLHTAENSLLLKLSAHPTRTELPPPSSQGVPVSHSQRWNQAKKILVLFRKTVRAHPNNTGIWNCDSS